MIGRGATRETTRALGSARVVGLIEDTPDGAVEVYRGIRYATAERFRAPVVDTPGGTSLALHPGAQAPQPSNRATGRTSETECLNLTIWRPAAKNDKPMPVIVWIHGGAHMYGSSANPVCDGARLAAREGCIVAAINYRLGALGHLWLADALGDEFLDSGNLALLDQRAALIWLASWIDRFGGDTKRLTLMGQSSGGVDVVTQLAISGEEPLFHRAIAHSASGERAMSTGEAINIRDELVRTLGLAHPRHLLAVNAARLMDAQETLVSQRSDGRASMAIPFQPVVDDRLLTALPLELIAAGAGDGVPLLIGTNRNEASGWIDLGEYDDEVLWPLIDVLESTDASDLALAYELDRGTPARPSDVHEAVLAELLYRLPAQRVLHARHAAAAATYSYVFDWKRREHGPWPRAAGHSLELPFVFRHLDDSLDACAEVGPDAPWALADRMSAAWASFARTGVPDSEREWVPYRPGGVQMLWGECQRTASGIDGALRGVVAATGLRYEVH